MWGWVLIGGIAYLLFTRQPKAQVLGAELASLSIPDVSGLSGGGNADDTGFPTPDYLDPTSGGLILGPPNSAIIGVGPVPGNLQPGESVAPGMPGSGVCR